MLYIVLILVLAAFGLLILALTTAVTLWAWLSVAVSVGAAALLVYDWLGGRRRRKADAVEDGNGVGVDDTEKAGTPPAARTAAAPIDPPPVVEPPAPFEPPPPVELAEPATRVIDHTPDFVPPPPPVADTPPAIDHPAEAEDPTEEPGEEATDASDLLVVSELAAEVRVVDEHPRYHLTRCGWLATRQTIPLPVSEARQLGFTPCARCSPDASLAARHRAG